MTWLISGSDAFSSFYHPHYRAERKNDMIEVQEATLFLFDSVLPSYVERIMDFARTLTFLIKKFISQAILRP